VGSWLRSRWALLVVLAVVAGLATSLHRSGHGWGDDFTLYIRQAKSLVDGNVGQVISDNHFNVDNAAKPSFSPYVYPWGFPILLAPFYRLFGLAYGRLKMVEVACMVGYLWCFHEVIRRRTQRWVALGVVAAVGTTMYYLLHTDALLSEYPYMLALAATLWWLDRCRRNGPLHHAPRNELIALGVLAMVVFNVRREGIAMVPAIAAVQLVDLRGNWRGADRRRIATPYVSFVVSVVLLQFALPSALMPEYAGSGLGQTWKKLKGSFRTAFGDQLGMPGLKGVLLLAVLVLVVAGIVVRLRRAPGDDIGLAVFAVLSMVLVGMIPAVDERYLMAVTPFALYFAVQAIAALPLPRSPKPVDAAWLAVAALVVLVGVNLTRLPGPIRDVRKFDDSGQIVDGPAAPYVQPAWTAVRTYTHQDDVVAFFKVRALTLYTNRRGVQSSDLEIVRQRADYYLMRRGRPTGQPLVTDDQAASLGWTSVWSDDSWVLWHVSRPTG
jgi:hypothetical protein